MNTTWMRNWLAPAVCAMVVVLDTYLAWDGDNFALIMLATIALFLCVGMGLWSTMAKSSLDGWGETVQAWTESAAPLQEWGMSQSKILQDALVDLAEHDEEAATIHAGRATGVNSRYIEATKESSTHEGG